MEIRAMALLEFGCPPLPLSNGTRIETNEPVVINSHDLLAVFMAQAFKQQDLQQNLLRKAHQQEIETNYREDMHNSDASVDSIYQAMTKYTRSYLATYLLPPFSIDDVRVLSMDFISPALLAEMHNYHNALHFLRKGSASNPSPPNLQTVLKGCHRLLIDPDPEFPSLNTP